MKTAIITVAGISSRFNEGVPEDQKCLKAVYWEEDPSQTLLYHLVRNCSFTDRIILVGGYQFDALEAYVSSLEEALRDKIILVLNEHYEDLGSGYSLFLGLEQAFRFDNDEILFVEGDLDIDKESFDQVIRADQNVITYNHEPIYANKAVVLYQEEDGKLQYAFNSSHGLLKIDSAFSFILNSGQMWKFTDIPKLKQANELFIEKTKGGTNLVIIQNYLDTGVPYELIGLKRWTNCNTKEDYRKITAFWEEEK